ncbi:MAG: hypothetical protein K0R83_39 [Caulobacter sp.]|jgi:hypothetical protein|nr:hypothetical protein [Caulobacter sp.]
MQHSPEARTPPPASAGLEALRGPRLRLRLAASVGGDLIVDGRLRPAIDLKQGGHRGRGLVYSLVEAGGGGRRIEPASLNAIDAERVDLAVVDAAFAALKAPAAGERPPLLLLPLNWTSLRSEKVRRKLLRRVAAGQIDHGVLVLCEVVGLEPGVAQSQVREVIGGLKPIFRGVLARSQPHPRPIRALEGCGFIGAALDTHELEGADSDAVMLNRVRMLQAIGPGVLVHGVRSTLALAAARGAGASWASLDIQPGGEALMAETKAAAGSPRPPRYVLVD